MRQTHNRITEKQSFHSCDKQSQKRIRVKGVSQYSKSQRRWILISNEWVDTSRHDSHRLEITDKDQIINHILKAIMDRLQVTFVNTEDLMFE